MNKKTLTFITMVIVTQVLFSQEKQPLINATSTQVDIKEDNNVTSDENGLLTIKTEVSATYKKQTKQEKEGK